MSYYKPFYQSAYDRTAPVYPPSQYGPSYYGPYDRPYSYQSRAPMRGEQWSEYIPVEQRYTDYVPETKIEYRPVEKQYTDYIEVKHETDYVPVPRLEKRVEYIPVDRYDEHVDYVPVQNSHVVKGPQSRVGYGSQSQYLPPPPPAPTSYSNYRYSPSRVSGYRPGATGYGYRYL
ncbi:unnamed protein product (macronuclear) [Paramecium tetraurelia]|uniref:Uncharacterized protein n=1 Tax=Paramecium tetraurelia TaxID=5888 RepID=A0BVT8_PARTE|nr:uncharacterized protein GSPATT00032507001 [Paramecium tetraurelia]CAK62655.1 unnamed protein product [Paramecium tetraurelia]|eukprot:XP_001430053.1 hypothetical protein (macronuclear) [Paramecium tetraurelia strain d4-2]